MTLNLTFVNFNYIACATDRRVTAADGRIMSERSMKLTCFVCKTGRGFIVYNGVGCDRHGVTPSDWLMEIKDLGNLTVPGLAEQIKLVAEPKLAALAPDFNDNPRHTFVMGAFEGPLPVVGMISNYESLAASPVPVARKEMSVELQAPTTHLSRGALLATGNDRGARKTLRNRLAQAYRDRGPATTVVPLMVKCVRDAAYAEGRKGTVGTSVVSAVWPLNSGANTQLHVVGGTAVREVPNYISPGSIMKDIWFQAGPPGAKFVSRYDPKTGRGVLAEPPCPACGAPVPEGYELCGACGAPIHKW